MNKRFIIIICDKVINQFFCYNYTFHSSNVVYFHAKWKIYWINLLICRLWMIDIYDWIEENLIPYSIYSNSALIFSSLLFSLQMKPNEDILCWFFLLFFCFHELNYWQLRDHWSFFYFFFTHPHWDLLWIQFHCKKSRIRNLSSGKWIT